MVICSCKVQVKVFFRNMYKPKLVILLSGKRKAGKDFVAEKLQKRLGEQSQIVRISEPIKSEWAKKMNLDLKELLSDGPYKERFRKDMITWSDEVRAKDYGYFCKVAMEKARADIIIVSDVRRKNDIKFFQKCYSDKIFTIRLTCPNEKRVERGWTYIAGIDNVESECGLDDYEYWNLVIENDDRLEGNQIVDIIINQMEIERIFPHFQT